MPNLAELDAAADLVHQVVQPSAQICWPLLSARAGTETWVKHENHNPTGAFKVRGGLVYIDDLRRNSPEVPGVIAATTGNHGQSIALAATRNGLTATIVPPVGNSPEKTTPCVPTAPN
jgi:threonine dehydratase